MKKGKKNGLSKAKEGRLFLEKKYKTLEHPADFTRICTMSATPFDLNQKKNGNEFRLYSKKHKIVDTGYCRESERVFDHLVRYLTTNKEYKVPMRETLWFTHLVVLGGKFNHKGEREVVTVHYISVRQMNKLISEAEKIRCLTQPVQRSLIEELEEESDDDFSFDSLYDDGDDDRTPMNERSWNDQLRDYPL